MPPTQYCSVKGCLNEEGNQVFKLQTRPLKLKSLERRNKWLRALGISLSTRIKRIKVCSKHFCEHDVEVGTKYSSDRLLRLKPTAVPHFLVPNESPCQALVKEEDGVEKKKNGDGSNVIEPEAVVVPSNCLSDLLDEESNVGEDSVFLVQDCEELKSFTELATEKPTIAPQKESSLVLKEIRVRIPGINTMFPLCRICCNPLIDKVGDPMQDLTRNDVKTVQTMLKLMLPTSEWQMYRDAVICDKCLKLVEQTFQLIESFIKTTETLNELHEKTKNVFPSEQNLLILKRSWPTQTPPSTATNTRVNFQNDIRSNYQMNDSSYSKRAVLPKPPAVTTRSKPDSNVSQKTRQEKENIAIQEAQVVFISAPPLKQKDNIVLQVQVAETPETQKENFVIQQVQLAPPPSTRRKQSFGIQQAQVTTSTAPIKQKLMQSQITAASTAPVKPKENFVIQQVQVATTPTAPVKLNFGVQQAQVTTTTTAPAKKTNLGIQSQVTTTAAPPVKKPNLGIQSQVTTTATPPVKKPNLGIQSQVTPTTTPPIKQNVGVQQAQVTTTQTPPIKIQQAQSTATPTPPTKQAQVTTTPIVIPKINFGIQRPQVTAALAPPVKQNLGIQSQVTTAPAPPKKQNYGGQQTPTPPVKHNFAQVKPTSAPPMNQKNRVIQQAHVTTTAPSIKRKLSSSSVTTVISNFDPGPSLRKESSTKSVECSKPTINLRRNFDLPASAIQRNPSAFPVRIRKVILKTKTPGGKQGPVLNNAKVQRLINLIKRGDSTRKLVKIKKHKVEGDADKKTPKTICCCVCYETFPDSMTLVQHLSLAGCKGPREKSDLVITGL